jgi:hypothetical protein
MNLQQEALHPEQLPAGGKLGGMLARLQAAEAKTVVVRAWAGELQGRETETAQWLMDARLDKVEELEFCRMTARLELIRRALAPAQAAVELAHERARAARLEFGTAYQSYLKAFDERNKARDQGQTTKVATIDTQIAAMLEEIGPVSGC